MIEVDAGALSVMFFFIGLFLGGVATTVLTGGEW